MQLGFTIPLQKHLNIKTLPYPEPRDARFCWDLHIISLRGCKSLLAVNCANRYAFTLFDMRAAHWRDLDARFLDGLRHSVCEAGISEFTIARYLHLAGDVTRTKTHGRREVAFLNRAWDDVAAWDCNVDSTQQYQPFLDFSVNKMLSHCASRTDYGTPAAWLAEDLQSL